MSTLPAGLEQYTGFWSHTLLGGYGFNSGDHPSLAYLLSAVVGIAVVAGLVFIIATIVRAVARARDDQDETASGGARGTRA